MRLLYLFYPPYVGISPSCAFILTQLGFVEHFKTTVRLGINSRLPIMFLYFVHQSVIGGVIRTGFLQQFCKTIFWNRFWWSVLAKFWINSEGKMQCQQMVRMVFWAVPFHCNCLYSCWCILEDLCTWLTKTWGTWMILIGAGVG